MVTGECDWLSVMLTHGIVFDSMIFMSSLHAESTWRNHTLHLVLCVCQRRSLAPSQIGRAPQASLQKRQEPHSTTTVHHMCNNSSVHWHDAQWISLWNVTAAVNIGFIDSDGIGESGETFIAVNGLLILVYIFCQSEIFTAYYHMSSHIVSNWFKEISGII